MTPPAMGVPFALLRRLPSPRVAWWFGLAVVWILGSLFLWQYLDRGWTFHDDGYLAHSAERVLLGQLPHRDFTEVYTGGLTYLNAFAFRVFGRDLLALRYMLFAAFLLWVPALYYAASRLTRPLGAALVTLLAVLWSVPNYPSNMPSWYNLFFATFGLAAFLVYVDRPRATWLVLAGVAGGLSVLFKISGLFFVGAGLLGLVFYVAREPLGSIAPERGRAAFRVMAGVPLVLAALSLVLIAVSRERWVDLYHFAMPGLAVTVLAGFAVLQAGPDSGARARRVATVLGWYLLGVGLPLLGFVLFYLRHGALDDLVRGVFLLPRLRYSDVGSLPLAPLAAGSTLFLGLVILAGSYVPRRLTALYHGSVVFGLAAALSLVAAGARRVHDSFFWNSLSQATPWLVVGLMVLIGRSRCAPGTTVRNARWVFVAAAAALCSLIQYPAAVPVYFCYVAPLTLLVVLSLAEQIPTRGRSALAAFAAIYLVFGALFLVPFQLVGLAGPTTQQDLARLELPRGGLIMDRESALLVRESVELLREHAKSGATFALDAPELYFLSGLKNPTSTIFDFAGDPHFRRGLAKQLADLGVDAIAIRHGTQHNFLQSPPFDPELLADLERLYPFSREIEGITVRFTIRWRDRSDQRP